MFHVIHQFLFSFTWLMLYMVKVGFTPGLETLDRLWDFEKYPVLVEWGSVEEEMYCSPELSCLKEDSSVQVHVMSSIIDYWGYGSVHIQRAEAAQKRVLQPESLRASGLFKYGCSDAVLMLSFSQSVRVKPVCSNNPSLKLVVFVSGCDEPSEEDHLAWRRDRETSWIPDVDQTQGAAHRFSPQLCRWRWVRFSDLHMLDYCKAEWRWHSDILKVFSTAACFTALFTAAGFRGRRDPHFLFPATQVWIQVTLNNLWSRLFQYDRTYNI